MPDRPQTQDHKPKKGAPFKFKGKDGKSYTLPNVTVARDKMSGGDFEDAVIDGEVGMSRYLVQCLRLSGASPTALEQLRALPTSKYMDVLFDWGAHGDGDGASLGE